MKTKRSLIQLCLLVLAMLVLLPSAKAQFTFTTNNGAITITGYNTAAGLNVVIPASTNGYPVTAIGDNAFNSGNTVTNITIPTSITSIGGSAFRDCSSLKSITIPNSVTNIGSVAFQRCNSLKSITIPSSIVSFGASALDQCNGLTNITVAAGNANYSSLNGVLFDYAQRTLFQFPGGLGGSYVIPNSVTNIVSVAFGSCTNLTNLTIGNNVTTIGNSAFVQCTSLISVSIGNGLTTIGVGLFNGCSSLTSMNIPNSVTSIKPLAFAFNYSLTNITIPNSVTNIASSVFYDCFSLTSVFFQGNAPSPTNDTSVFDSDGSASIATAYYLSGTTGWGATFDGIPTAVYGALSTPPALAISTYSNQPAVFFPTATGTNFVLQMSTNLANGNWVTVSNGIPISGIIVTNPPGTAFFRLH